MESHAIFLYFNSSNIAKLKGSVGIIPTIRADVCASLASYVIMENIRRILYTHRLWDICCVLSPN